jgi:PBSX family phage portal protein
MAEESKTKKERRSWALNPSDITDGAQMPRLLQNIVSKADATQQIPDPFTGFYGGGNTNSDGSPRIIEPEYCPSDLISLPGMSSTLSPCIDAMVTNCELTGFSLVYEGKEGKQASKEAKEERDRILGLLSYPNPDEPLIIIREKIRKDYESVGWAALEVTRSHEGEITGFYHVPAHSLRMTVKDTNETLIKAYRYVGNSLKHFQAKKRFRRWVQLVGSRQKVYFKEFGDPRPIFSETGGIAKKGTPTNELATELVVFSQFTPGFAYALPRYINQIPAILGSREAELTNLHFFKDNAIPAMAVLVSGGYLTDDTMKNLQDRFQANRGRKSFHKVLIIEAQVDDESKDAADGPVEHPRLEFKTLSHDRQQDALFLEYEQSNANKIRSAFRLPPIFIGLTSDYTRATATASLELAENQVFAPERAKFDAIFNTTVLLDVDKPPRYWRMRSNGGKVVGATSISETLMRLEKVGACTPNVAIQMARTFLNMDIELVDKEWGDMPFEFTKALLKNGNMGINGEFIENSLRHPASIPDEEGAAGKTKPDNDMGFGKAKKDDDDDEADEEVKTTLEDITQRLETLEAKAAK